MTRLIQYNVKWNNLAMRVDEDRLSLKTCFKSTTLLRAPTPNSPFWTEDICCWPACPPGDKNTKKQKDTFNNFQVPVPNMLLIKVISTVNRHLYSAFLTSGHSKHLTKSPQIHPLTHRFTHRRQSQPLKATASSSRAVRVRRLAQGHHGSTLR